MPGASLRIERITPTNAVDPRSGRSSRSTLVMTAWRRSISLTFCATRSGSSGSLCVGWPVLTLQKPQRRVQVSPRIMNVAVPDCQHSPMFGQAASSQTVCSDAPSILALSSRYLGDPGALTLNHGGLRSRYGRTSSPMISRTLAPPGFARDRVLTRPLRLPAPASRSRSSETIRWRSPYASANRHATRLRKQPIPPTWPVSL